MIDSSKPDNGRSSAYNNGNGTPSSGRRGANLAHPQALASGGQVPSELLESVLSHYPDRQVISHLLRETTLTGMVQAYKRDYRKTEYAFWKMYKIRNSSHEDDTKSRDIIAEELEHDRDEARNFLWEIKNAMHDHGLISAEQESHFEEQMQPPSQHTGR